MIRIRGGHGMRGWVAVVIGMGGPLQAAGQEADSLLRRPAFLDVRAEPVADALRALQRSSGVALAFSSDLLPVGRFVDCPCMTLTVAAALDRILEGTGLTYREGRRQVLIGRGSDGGAVTPPDRILGFVVEEGIGRPVAGAEIVTDSGTVVLTGDDGRFVLARMAARGVRSLRVEALGYRPTTVSLTEGVSAVRVEIERAPIPLAELVIAPGSFGVLDVAPTTAGISVSREDIEAIPQIGDDVFRTLKRMPGVSTDDVSTRLSVRGGTPREVLVRLDGLELFEPYHLKDLDGALGIVDVQALGGIDLVTGGFPVEFGDRTSAVFDMHSRRPPAEGTRTTLGLSLSSLSAVSQGSFAGGRGHWLGSARRGFLEYLLAVTEVSDDLRPTYWDALGRVHYLPSDRHALSAQVLYAGDDMRWLDGATGSGVRSAWTNGYGWVTWASSWNGRLRTETVASVGRLTRDRVGDANNPDGGGFSPLTSAVRDLSTVEFGALRQDVSLDLGPDLLVKAGGEFRGSSANYDYAAHSTRYAVDGSGALHVSAQQTAVSVAPSGREGAGWMALRGRLGRFSLEGGARFDRYTLTDDSEWSPRLLGRWDPDERTSMKGSWGRYVQGQGIHELASQDGQDTFRSAEVAHQAALGVERRVEPGRSAGSVPPLCPQPAGGVCEPVARGESDPRGGVRSTAGSGGREPGPGCGSGPHT